MATGLTGEVVKVLGKHGPMRHGEIAELLGQDRRHTRNALDNAVKRKYINKYNVGTAVYYTAEPNKEILADRAFNEAMRAMSRIRSTA